ncbi:PPOX class F420-dependent oxidoreductase [Streptomyces sp. NPDC000410]|uniref:PPOX class F420-dependent oxidoreductase n=1 Tax=Streptomyces sp. NPDC000410 TaxID=3154254 RepID=UPI0033228A06
MPYRSDELASARRLWVTTFTPDGAPVRTAAWVVADGNALGICVPTDSPPAQWVRSCRTLLIAACPGDEGLLRAKATLCGPELTVRYRTHVINKYGVTALLALALHRFRNGLDGTVGIRITPAGPRQLLLGPAWQPAHTYSLN